MTTLAQARGHTFTHRASYELPLLDGKPVKRRMLRRKTERKIQPLPPCPVPSNEEATRAVYAFRRMSSADRILARVGLNREQVAKITGGGK